MNNLSRLCVIYTPIIRTTAMELLFMALAALIGFSAAHAVGKINEAFIAQDKLAIVEDILVRCLNGESFSDTDGMIINCSGVTSTKYKLTGKL